MNSCSRRNNTDAEYRVIARAKRLLTIQIAAVITLLVAFVGAIALFIMVNSQRTEADREVSRVAAAPNSAPLYACDILFLLHNGRLTAKSGSITPPQGLPVTADLDQVARTGTPIRSVVAGNGTKYTVLTEKHGDLVAQAAYDLRYQLADRHLLMLGLGVAEIAGLLVAVITGYLLAGRAIHPLGEALHRQRRFVADASHELRAPLTQLHTRAQLLARRTRRDRGSDAITEELDRLVTGTRQLGEVVEDLLLSARLRAQPQQLTPIDFGALVREAVAAEQLRARCNGITITFEGAERPYLVDGVATALRRVVAALIDNAVGHTNDDGAVTLTLREIPATREFELTVADNGVGFDPADAERIFERFARGATGNGRRFGLGLALVREVVRSHNGTITASSEPGHGATFTLRLPIHRPAPAPRRRAGAETGPVTPTPSPRRPDTHSAEPA
ncbi:MAG TPA: HAMP domain-containing sensor histidine kinase [Pseudonocardiaceae bacterium]|nr:HAMP domain-containing sensor histidine kinase [Pseudonocardiaceae bacterium]